MNKARTAPSSMASLRCPAFSACSISSARISGKVPCPLQCADLQHQSPHDSLLSSKGRTSRAVAARSKKDNIGDELLDFIQAGRKLRRWYGEEEREEMMAAVSEKGRKAAQEEEDMGDGDAVLVTDSDGALGEQVVLQLILARANVKLLVKDTVAAKTAYGPYVTPISGDIESVSDVKKALRGVGSVVAVGKLGALPKGLQGSGVSHVVLLSRAGMASEGGLFGSLFQMPELGVLADASREAGVLGCGVPYSIVKAATIRQSPGGMSGIALQQQLTGGAAKAGSAVSCEDLAAVLVATLRRPPSEGRVFTVSSSGPGQLPEDWAPLFKQIPEVAGAAS